MKSASLVGDGFIPDTGLWADTGEVYEGLPRAFRVLPSDDFALTPQFLGDLFNLSFWEAEEIVKVGANAFVGEDVGGFVFKTGQPQKQEFDPLRLDNLGLVFP